MLILNIILCNLIALMDTPYIGEGNSHIVSTYSVTDSFYLMTTYGSNDDQGLCLAGSLTPEKDGEKGHTCPREVWHSMCSAHDETHEIFAYVSNVPLLDDFSRKTAGLLTFITPPMTRSDDTKFVKEEKGKASSDAHSNINPVMVIFQEVCKWKASHALSIFEDSAQCDWLDWIAFIREHCVRHVEDRSKWKVLWNKMKRKLQMLANIFPFILIATVCLKLVKEHWNRKNRNKEQNISGENQVQSGAAHGLVGDNSEVHSLKNEISVLQHEHRKVCWRKDILIVAKTVMAQGLMEEIHEKDCRLCSLEEQLHTVKQEKESLAGEKCNLLSQISRYENDMKALQVSFFEMVKKVEKADLAQKENENEIQDLRNQVKNQSRKSVNIQQQLDFLKEKSVQLAKEKSDMCHHVSDLENEVNKIRAELCETKKQCMETDLAKVNAEKEVKTLKNKVQIKNKEIVRLQAQITAIQQREKLLMTENDKLCSRICDYGSESCKLKADIAEMKQQMKENDLAKTNTKKKIEVLMKQLQLKNDENRLLHERITTTQLDMDSLASEKVNLCNRILDYETKTQKMKTELCEMKQKYVAQKNIEKELEDQTNKMRLQNTEIEHLQSNVRALEEEKVGLVSRIKEYETEVADVQKQLCEVRDEMQKKDLAQANTGHEVRNMRDQLQSMLDLPRNTDALNHQEKTQPLQVIEADDSSSNWSSYSSDSDDAHEAEDCKSPCSSDSPPSFEGSRHIIRTRRCVYEISQQYGDKDPTPVRKIAKGKRRHT